MRRRYLILLILAALAASGSLAASHWHLSWLESLASNLAAGFLGTFLTVFLIDTAIARERERESRRVRALALGQLRSSLLRQLDLLCGWFKAAAKHKPTTQLSDLKDIFSDEYYDEVLFFDFSKAAPTSPPMAWFRWSATEMVEFRTGLNTVLDKYAAFLDAETLEILEALANSPIPGSLIPMANWPAAAPPTGGKRTYNILAGQGVIGELRRHVGLLMKLVAKFNAIVPRPITIADLPLWREDVGGPFGAARMTDEEMGASNPMFAIGRGVPPLGGPSAVGSKP